MNFICEIIHYDLYPKNARLRIGNSSFTSPIYSQLITKLVIVLCIFYFVNNVIDVFERNRLISNTTTRKTYHRSNINLNSNNFKFAFAIFDSDGEIIIQSELERYYVPHFYLMSTINQGGTVINVTRDYSNLRNCTNDDFSNLDDAYVELNNLTMYSCPEYFNFSINGNYDEKYTNLIVFRLDYCESNTYNNCKPIDEIQSKLQGGILNMYLLDNDVDLTNYENPFLSFIKLNYFENIDLNNNFEQYIYFKNVEIQTDQSFIWKDYQTKTNFQFAEMANIYSGIKYLSLSSSQTPTFYDFNIYVYEKVDTINRSYDKIWDAISSLGGIMKIIIGIGFLLTRKYNECDESISLIKSNNLINHIDNEKVNKNEKLKNKLMQTNFEVSILFSNRLNNSSLNLLNSKKPSDSLNLK